MLIGVKDTGLSGGVIEGGIAKGWEEGAEGGQR